MPQDRESGATASAWGRETARKIAEHIGATSVSTRSNECVMGTQRVVIKCAAPDTRSVGVTYKMLDRIDLVLGAFQSEDDGWFSLVSLSRETFRTHMSPTRSKGPSRGKVGIVAEQIFYEHGAILGTVDLDQ